MIWIERKRILRAPMTPHEGGATNPRHRRRGFTLLELVVALAITTAISAVVGSALYTAYGTKKSAQRAMEQARAGSILTNIITQDLSNALSPNGIFAGPFSGVPKEQSQENSDYLSFYATGGDTQALVPGDFKRVEYYISNEPGMLNTLVRKVTTNLSPGDNVVESPEEPLCRNVTAFSVTYFDGTTWNTAWDSTAHLDSTGLGMLPMAVAINIEISPPEKEVQHVSMTISVPSAWLDTTTGGQ